MAKILPVGVVLLGQSVGLGLGDGDGLGVGLGGRLGPELGVSIGQAGGEELPTGLAELQAARPKASAATIASRLA